MANLVERQLVTLVDAETGNFAGFRGADGTIDQNMALLSTDANGNTVLVDPTGVNPYGKAAPDLDADGNLAANVNLRTGFLADLISVSGGISEVSRPTDVKALILHNGNANEASTVYRTGQIGSIVSTEGSNTGVTAIPTGVTGGALRTSSVAGNTINTFGNAVSADLTTFTIPSSNDARKAVIAVSFGVLFGASSVGSVRSVALEVDLDGLGDWVEAGETVVVSGSPVVASQVLRGTVVGKATIISGTTCRFRLLCKQDSGAAMPVKLDFMEARIYRNDR